MQGLERRGKGGWGGQLSSARPYGKYRYFIIRKATLALVLRKGVGHGVEDWLSNTKGNVELLDTKGVVWHCKKKPGCRIILLYCKERCDCQDLKEWSVVRYQGRGVAVGI